MAVWSELWNSILQARLDQMGWNLKWFIFELFLTEIVNDFLIKTANFKMWFYAVSKMLHLTLTLCLSLASQQMAFFPICILPCLWFRKTFERISRSQKIFLGNSLLKFLWYVLIRNFVIDFQTPNLESTRLDSSTGYPHPFHFKAVNLSCSEYTIAFRPHILEAKRPHHRFNPLKTNRCSILYCQLYTPF